MMLVSSLNIWNIKCVSLSKPMKFNLDDGINIDNWTFEGLVQVVDEFRRYQD